MYQSESPPCGVDDHRAVLHPLDAAAIEAITCPQRIGRLPLAVGFAGRSTCY
jgi:hypothetical protein